MAVNASNDITSELEKHKKKHPEKGWILKWSRGGEGLLLRQYQ